MTKMEIARILRNSRQKSRLTGTEVIDKLKAKGYKYSVKALYNWETGRSQPDCNIFIHLCDIYGIKNILQTFGHDINYIEKRSFPLREQLQNRIDQLDENSCKIVMAYMDGYLSRKDQNTLMNKSD